MTDPATARGGPAWLRALYDWTMGLAGHRHAVWVLFGIAFIESSVFPIPPDVLLIAMVLAARQRAWWFAAVCTAGSVLGGLGGYAIGFFLFEAVGQPVLNFYGYADKFAEFQAQYNDLGGWIVFGAGLTPFPYKVITIASGVTALDPAVFTGASVISRGMRFFLVAGLLWFFGAWMRDFIERYLGLLTTLFFLLLIGGFVLLKYVL